MGLFLGLGLAVCASSAQEAPEEEEDVQTLSPFEVTGTEDQGYIATQTLAGTRLRMDLSDVGSAVSVYTEELMDDLAADDNETLLAYGLNTEVGGGRGNFINPNTEGLENDNLIDPQSNNRIRGLTSADSTRNFFKSDVPWDGYNTHRIDVHRGPNSILFGLGSPAGIINNATRTALMDDINEVTARVDSHGSWRLQGNFNQEVFEDQFAVRADILVDKRDYQQDPAFEDDTRFHFAGTWNPVFFNNENVRSSLSFNYESGSIEANRPRTVVPLNSVQNFFIPANENGFLGADYQNGGPLGPGSDIFGPGGQTYNPVADETALDSIAWLATPPNNNARPLFVFDARNPGTFDVVSNGLDANGSFLVLEDNNSDDTAVVVNNGAYVNPFATRDRDVFVRGTRQNVFTYAPLVTLGKQRVANDNRVAFPGFWRDQSFSSTDQFNYMDHLIDGNNKLEQTDFDVFEVNFRNTFFQDRIGYQLSYFSQELTFRQDANLGAIFAPEIQVEANSTSPQSTVPGNPESNPTAGRAFVDFELRLRGGREDIRNRDTLQAQLFASVDSRDYLDNDLLSYIFGSHDFIALFKNRKFERIRREFNSMGVDEQTIRAFGGERPDNEALNPRFDPANTDPGPGARAVRLANAFGSVQPRIRVYLESTGPNLTGLQPFSDPIVPSGSYSIRSFDATPLPGFDAAAAGMPWIDPSGDESFQANNPANYVGIVDKPGFNIVKATDSQEALEYLTTRRFYDDEDVDTMAFTWSAAFFNRAVVGMYGYREDDVVQRGLEHDFGRIEEENEEGRTGGHNFDPNSEFLRVTEGSFESTNWSVKVDPLRFISDLNIVDDDFLPFNIAFLYSKGEVQNPQPGRRDVLLNDLAPSTGETTDKSIAISTKDGRFTFRFTDFETVQANANAGSVAASENWRIEQVLREGIRNGVVPIERGDASRANAVLDNGDDVDDPGELSVARSEEIRDLGYTSAQDWLNDAASSFRAMEQELFSRWPATQSWITGGEPGTDFINVNFPDDTVFIEDNTSRGQEYEFLARPTPNWNILVNASRTEVLRSKVFGDEVNEVLDFIVGELSGPAGTVPLWGPGGQFTGTRVAPFLGQLITNRALLGTPTGELREWKLNVVTSYNFTDGPLDGFGVGLGYRYEDPQVIGFPPIYIDPVTGEPQDVPQPNSALSVDLDSPFEDDARHTYDLWLKYKTRLFDKVDWRIQLNVFNVADDEGTVPLLSLIHI